MTGRRDHARRPHPRFRVARGFTLIDLAAVGVVLAVGAAVLAATGSPWTKASMRTHSLDNLRRIGQVASVYAWFNSEAIPSYSWKRDVLYGIYGNPLAPHAYDSDQGAHAAQNWDILNRLTGRISGSPSPIVSFSTRIPDRRYSHLVLLDFAGWDAIEPVFTAPDDVNLLRWQASPLDLSIVPYADGIPDGGYDTDTNWTKKGIKQRWPYASSYQWVPASWQLDQLPCYYPVHDTPNLFAGPADAELGGRTYDDVRFPSAKVFVHEEFEWAPRLDPRTRAWVSDGTYFAYPQARVGKLMFDGSVNSWVTGGSRRGWNPAQPSVDWRQRYLPLDTFPLWPASTLSNEIWPQWFRWTRLGLQGIDYGAPDPRLNDRAVDVP